MLSPEQALSHWGMNSPIHPSADQGLINQTWIVGEPPSAVLQWVNPIFHHSIHDDISAIVQHLKLKGCQIPSLIQCNNGSNCLAEEDGTWRMLSYIPGRTIHSIPSNAIAAAAGKLVGQFHAALLDFEHKWVAPRRDVHNSPARISELQTALEKADGHPLEAQARTLGRSIIRSWEAWNGNLELPLRVCHGDLKISNLRFSSDTDRGICLIDLDTLGPQTLSAEMGDAWRSWCNPAGESNPDEVYFDVGLFEASASTWAQQIPILESIEKEHLVSGIERICLELSARFCADAINNSYFKEDRQRYPQIGLHNLIRGTAQYRLAQSALHHRSACEHIIKEQL